MCSSLLGCRKVCLARMAVGLCHRLIICGSKGRVKGSVSVRSLPKVPKLRALFEPTRGDAPHSLLSRQTLAGNDDVGLPDTWPATKMARVTAKPKAKLMVRKPPWVPRLSTT